LAKELIDEKVQFSPEQITFALRQAESGTSVPEICRKMRITKQTFYRWKKKYLGGRSMRLKPILLFPNVSVCLLKV
jgi:hypothetical protein